MSAALYDDVVVGAGSAGAPLAARLSEDADRRVLLLEAGPDYRSVEEIPPEMVGRATSDAGIDHDWRFQAEATPGRIVEYPAGKVTGGSSAVNSGVALRGAPADYDEWAALGNPGWAWDDVLPYFRRLESDQDFDDDFHGGDGPIPIARPKPAELVHVHRALRDAALAMGFPAAPDLNRPGASGVGPWPMNIRGGIRISTALGYLTAEVRARRNLDIRPGAAVRRVLFNRARAVTGVETQTPGGTELVPASRVTLCAGAIATPGILLRSGIGAPARVRAARAEVLVDLPGVGEHLMDHPFIALCAVPVPGVCDLDRRSVQIGLRYTAGGSDERDDMQLLVAVPVDLRPTPALAERVGAERIVMIGAGLQRPRSIGRVTWPGRSALSRPRVELNIGSEPADMDRLRDGLRLAWRVAHSDAMAPHLRRVALLDRAAVEDDRALADYVRDGVNTFKHPAGTARMGPDSDPGAVVDAQCRVRGVEGLRVADASVMPNIPRANNNLTCIMIGERVADLMRGLSASAPAPAARMVTR